MTGVKGRSGRKHRSFTEAGTQQIIDGAAPKAAAILRDHIQGKRKRLSYSLQKACEYVIDHATGKAKAKPDEFISSQRRSQKSSISLRKFLRRKLIICLV